MKKTVLGSLLAGAHLLGFSQSLFQNLDFEQAVLTPLSRDDQWRVDPVQALPHWQAWRGDLLAPYVYSNGVSIGGALITVHDNNSPYPVVGDYTVYLFSDDLHSIVASISQTGFIPGGSKSLRLVSRPPDVHGARLTYVDVSFAGNALELLPLGPQGDFYLWGADIGRYAGQTGELRLSSGGPIDNIQFSPLEIPEPTVGTLLFLAAGLVLVRRHRTRAEWRGRRLMG